MRPVVLLLSLLLTTSFLAAQKSSGVEVRLSDKSKDPMKTIVYDLIDSNDDSYFIARLKQTLFNTSEIIIEKYAKNLKLQQAKVLSATVDGKDLDFTTAFLPHASMVKDDKLYLVFNDNEKNLTETKEDKVHSYNGKKSVAMLVTMQDDGSWFQSALFDNKVEGILLRPKICQQINDNNTLLYAEKGRTYKMGLLTF